MVCEFQISYLKNITRGLLHILFCRKQKFYKQSIYLKFKKRGIMNRQKQSNRLIVGISGIYRSFYDRLFNNIVRVQRNLHDRFLDFFMEWFEKFFVLDGIFFKKFLRLKMFKVFMYLLFNLRL